MRLKNVFFSILTTTLISACSSERLVDRVVVDSVPVSKTTLSLPDPEPLKMREIRFVVLTPDNQRDVFGGLETPVLIGMTTQSYEDMSRNILDLRGYILELRDTLRSYREYYEAQHSTENENEK